MAVLKVIMTLILTRSLSLLFKSEQSSWNNPCSLWAKRYASFLHFLSLQLHFNSFILSFHLKDASEFCLSPSVNEFFLLSRRLILAFERFSFKQVQNRLLAGILSLPTSMTVVFRYKTRELKLTILGHFSGRIPAASLWLINLKVWLIVSRYVGNFLPSYWKQHAV